MFTIRHYETPNKYKFISLRSERIKREKKIQRVLAVLTTVGTILAVLFFIACIGYVGEQDRQYELISNGVIAEEVSK